MIDRDVLPREYKGVFGQSWMSLTELEKIVELIPEDGEVLEIGTASGATAAVLACNKPNAHIVCVDNFEVLDKSNCASTDPDRLTNWFKNKKPNMNLWIGDICDLDALIGNEYSFDLIIVDASHEYEDVNLDLVYASQWINNDKSYICCHDYDDPTWPGVKQAVDEFCDNQGFKIIEIVGSLAILREEFKYAEN